MAPALLDLREGAAGRVDVVWKTSRFRTPGTALTPVLPERCRPADAVESSDADGGRLERWTVDCGEAGLAGGVVGVDGLAANRIDALLRVAFADGRTFQSVLRAGAPRVEIPARPGPVDVLVAYGRMGFEHILGGPDHLLFVFGLVLLVTELRALLLTISAFTIGHSVTLSLAALGVVRFPTGPIEVLIAASVLSLAVALARRLEGDVEPGPSRLPWIMAGGFGLLHGFGFAGALAEAGLPQGDIPLALFAFNVGIEVGQVAFVAVVVAARAALAPWFARLPVWAELVPVYAMGSVAAFWCFDRMALVLSGP
jgi:hydrogenase/urease accessory protein HupE